MDIIIGIIAFIYSFFYYEGIGDIGFIFFIVVFFSVWYIVSNIIIKIFKVKVNETKILVFTIFFILNIYNIDIYFECTKKINQKLSISMSKTKIALKIFEEKYPDDNFYMISPMEAGDYERYVGSFYSEKLKKLKFSDYFYACIERGKLDENYSFGHYKDSFVAAERNIFLEKELSNILGNRIKVRLGTDGHITVDKILKNATNKDSNETIRIWFFTVYIFLDKDETKEDYQKKINDVSKYLFRDLKLSGYNFSIDYVDSCYLNEYESVKNLIYFPLQDDENGIKILEKLKRKEEVTNEEKIYLIKLFGPFSNIPVISSDILRNEIPDKK